MSANVAWAITPEKVDAVIQRIIASANPKKIILFGSFARGEADSASDLDVLVVVDDAVEHCRRESVRIRRALRGISLSADILVVRETDFDRYKDANGLIYRTCATEGMVVYERP